MIMVVKESSKAYKQPIPTVTTAINDDLFKNLLMLNSYKRGLLAAGFYIIDDNSI